MSEINQHKSTIKETCNALKGNNMFIPQKA